jgi:hypothetical protein
MKVTNVHTRIIAQPIAYIGKILSTLATKEDLIWPHEHWPKMKFKNGLLLGEYGGHGPIRYVVTKYLPEACIEFAFVKPKGFNGIHKLELTELDKNRTELKHTISINTSGAGTFLWLIAIRSLHDALIEDALDKVENHFSNSSKKVRWSLWVRMLRVILH